MPVGSLKNMRLKEVTKAGSLYYLLDKETHICEELIRQRSWVWGSKLMKKY